MKLDVKPITDEEAWTLMYEISDKVDAPVRFDGNNKRYSDIFRRAMRELILLRKEVQCLSQDSKPELKS